MPDIPPSKVITKLLGPNDALILDNIADDVFDNPICHEWAAQFLNGYQNLLAVAIADATVVGMASAFVYLHPDKPPQLFINEVGVSVFFQRRGLAKRLIQLLLARGKQMGCQEAWVMTEEDNTAARALYTSLNGQEDTNRAVVYTYDLTEGDDEGQDDT